jgi:hypothetical protein
VAISVANSRTGSSTTLDFKLTMDTQAIDDKRLAKITRPARECCSVAGRGKQKKAPARHRAASMRDCLPSSPLCSDHGATNRFLDIGKSSA